MLNLTLNFSSKVEQINYSNKVEYFDVLFQTRFHFTSRIVTPVALIRSSTFSVN
jgi:hypothetical protein